jgi:hypothetical protein
MECGAYSRFSRSQKLSETQTKITPEHGGQFPISFWERTNSKSA